jgi:hypothetical protein
MIMLKMIKMDLNFNRKFSYNGETAENRLGRETGRFLHQPFFAAAVQKLKFRTIFRKKARPFSSLMIEKRKRRVNGTWKPSQRLLTGSAQKIIRQSGRLLDHSGGRADGE